MNQLSQTFEFGFVTQPVNQFEFQLGSVKVALEVEQVCFEALRRTIERGPGSKINNGVEGAPRCHCPARVNTRSRHQLGRRVDMNVGRRKSDLSSTSIARNDLTYDRVPPTEQRSCDIEVSARNRSSNAGAADRFPADIRRGDRMHPETVRLSQSLERIDITAPVPAESVIVSKHDSARTQVTHEIFEHEIRRLKTSDSVVERDDGKHVDSSFFDAPRSLVDRC